jgi:hypothetical protein
MTTVAPGTSLLIAITSTGTAPGRREGIMDLADHAIERRGNGLR